MIKILSQDKKMMVFLAGVFIKDSTNTFDYRSQIIGFLYGSNKELLLGMYGSKEQAQTILFQIESRGDAEITFTMPEDGHKYKRDDN